jgi:ATP-dependent DNA helicase RecQ
MPAPTDLAARAWALFRELLSYLDARTCRHDFILRYFGDEREVLGGCGHCDVCAALDESPALSAASSATISEGDDTSRIVRMALSAVARARQRAGMGAVAEMLVGADNDRTRRFGFTSLSTFGLLRDRPEPWVLGLLRGLLAAGWIDLTPTDHPVPLVTPAGADVMRGTGAVRFVLPPAYTRPRTRQAADAPREAPRRAPALDSLDQRARDRFERLRSCRAVMAKERGVPAYVVAHDRTLVEMAERAPQSHAELLGVFGMGPARVESYGDDFLAVLREP